jgi:transglutaminase-like putative cysteine protease
VNRRDFLRSAGVMSAGLAFSSRSFGETATATRWRTFEVTTRIEVLKPSGTTRVWLPAALSIETPYQKTLSNTFTAEGASAKLLPLSRADGLGVMSAAFPKDVKPEVVMTSRVSTRDYAVDLTARGAAREPARATLEHFLRSTKLLPTDGIVKTTADQITHGARSDVDKARAIYEWIVESTRRDPQTKGCGVGDIRFMLETRDLRGKCADLNALFVGLARASGIPARDVYGIRTVKSELGYKSLGASSNTITKAQHCRAEVHLTGYGWVPVDPADVRKVALEEPPGNRSLDDDMVKNARARLFGSWEMNWMAFNFAHDVALPGAQGAPVAFLMYPQAETDQGRLDCLDPDSFKYEILAREVTA